MIQISERAQNLGESVTLKMARLGRELKESGVDVISLSLGEPDFNTPEYIKSAAKKAIDDNHSHYTPVPGTKALQEAICFKFKRDNDLTFEPAQIVTSTGAKQSIMNVVLATVNPGDEVILPAPYWVSYIEMVKFAGGVPVVIDTDVKADFKITADQLENAISDKTRVFLFSNPCNPSGTVYTENELAELVKVFEKHSNILLISDEIYEHINYTDKHASLAAFSSVSERVVTVNGLSKGFAMTGWRLGYIAAPQDIAKACSKIQGQFTSGTCSITQEAAVVALRETGAEVAQMKEAFYNRRKIMIDGLGAIEGVIVNEPMGAFYIYPDVSSFYGKSYNEYVINNSMDLCMYLLQEAHVATTPGEAFGTPKNIRLSYAAEDNVLKEAVSRIEKALTQLK
jgi:aspartate aminotransferase